MTHDVAGPSVASAGYAKPLAWAVMNPSGHIYDIRITNPSCAPPLMPESDTAIPLVQRDSMRLTYAERCALASACALLVWRGETQIETTIRALMERLS